MSKHEAFAKALKLSKKRTAYVVWDCGEFRDPNTSDCGYHIARSEDFDSWYSEGQIIAEFDDGELVH